MSKLTEAWQGDGKTFNILTTTGLNFIMEIKSPGLLSHVVTLNIKHDIEKNKVIITEFDSMGKPVLIKLMNLLKKLKKSLILM